MECFNADLKADWERWQGNKRHDFKQLLTGMADKNVSYYEKVRRGPRGGAEGSVKRTARTAGAHQTGPSEPLSGNECLCFLTPSFIVSLFMY